MLFNGAFKKHTKNATYKKSRGLILLDLIASKFILNYFGEVSLELIEPFSIILFEDESLQRLV